MLSITVKRSAAALGVMAGLLAVVGPASAPLPLTATGVAASGGWPDGTSQNGALAAAKVTVPDLKLGVSSRPNEAVAATSTFGGGLSREPF